MRKIGYVIDKKGLLLRCIGRLIDGKASVERVELPHTTSSHVKFGYHRDGRAHFSQDGKIKTVVIGSLPPLVVHDGILFQVRAYGLDHYDPVKPRDLKAPSKKALVDCTPDPMCNGIVITGHISKPGMCTVESVGEPKLVTRSSYSPFLLALGYKPLRVPESYDGAYLFFIGGPSAPTIIAPGASRSVLVAVYPRGAGNVLYTDAVSADYESKESANKSLEIGAP